MDVCENKWADTQIQTNLKISNDLLKHIYTHTLTYEMLQLWGDNIKCVYFRDLTVCGRCLYVSLYQNIPIVANYPYISMYFHISVVQVYVGDTHSVYKYPCIFLYLYLCLSLGPSICLCVVLLSLSVMVSLKR